MSDRTMATPWGWDDSERTWDDWGDVEHNPPCPPEARCIVCTPSPCVDCFPGDPSDG